jgi:hypothetical protein
MDDQRPYGHDTLTLRAIFIPDGNPDNVSAADILRTIGPHAVTFPAVFVPDGSPLPGYPWVQFGRMTLPEPKAAKAPAGTSRTSRPPSRRDTADPGDAARQTWVGWPAEAADDRAGGVGLSDPRATSAAFEPGWAVRPLSQLPMAPVAMSAGPAPPTPALPTSHDDPVRAAMAALRALENPAGLVRASGQLMATERHPPAGAALPVVSLRDQPGGVAPSNRSAVAPADRQQLAFAGTLRAFVTMGDSTTCFYVTPVGPFEVRIPAGSACEPTVPAPPDIGGP